MDQVVLSWGGLMAWVSGDLDKLTAALGYPCTVEDIAAIQSAMDKLTALAPDTITRVQLYLTTIATIEGQIATARNATSGVLGQLRSEGRRFISLVAIALDIKPRNDVYSQ